MSNQFQLAVGCGARLTRICGVRCTAVKNLWRVVHGRQASVGVRSERRRVESILVEHDRLVLDGEHEGPDGPCPGPGRATRFQRHRRSWRWTPGRRAHSTEYVRGAVPAGGNEETAGGGNVVISRPQLAVFRHLGPTYGAALARRPRGPENEQKGAKSRLFCSG